jgi:hypothetical protein
VERLHADVSAVQPSLNEGPEVLDGVRVDAAVDVPLGVVKPRCAEANNGLRVTTRGERAVTRPRPLPPQPVIPPNSPPVMCRVCPCT